MLRGAGAGVDGSASVMGAPDVMVLQQSPRLRAFVDLLLAWNRRINLVARGEPAQLWHRHVLDSAQLWPLRGASVRRWADLGSGGGFPGLVIACLAADAQEPLHLTLVEADGRKAAFLREAAREAGLAAVDVRAERAEAVEPLAADVVSARALAPLDALWPMARRHLAPGGRAIFPKGGNHAAEEATARARFPLVVTVHRSATDPAGAILVVQESADG